MTDGQTDRHRVIAYTALCICVTYASRGKKTRFGEFVTCRMIHARINLCTKFEVDNFAPSQRSCKPMLLRQRIEKLYVACNFKRYIKVEGLLWVTRSLSTANLPLLSISAGSVQRVSSFKLLGLNFDASLSWSIAAKASKRLYFLKQLKRAGVPAQQLLHFYATVIRSVLEYCAPVWHYAIIRSQAEQLGVDTKACYSHYLSFHSGHVIF